MLLNIEKIIIFLHILKWCGEDMANSVKIVFFFTVLMIINLYFLIVEKKCKIIRLHFSTVCKKIRR